MNDVDDRYVADSAPGFVAASDARTTFWPSCLYG